MAGLALSARRLAAVAAVVVVAMIAVAAAAGCTAHDDGGAAGARPAADDPSSAAEKDHPRGGGAQVGIWEQPDVTAPTIAGAAVRALVLPQLFVAQPDGSWSPSLVAPRSDRTSADRRSATFRLRKDAVWSNGAPITAADLRRSSDIRFVAGVEGPAPDGKVTVRFTQPFPAWRRLWSGLDTVSAPAPGVWGGPFLLARSDPHRETVLRRNDRWYGKAPYLDEVRLVLVPDPITARQLLERGQLDVLMPFAGTNRTPQLRHIPDVSVDVATEGGWWAGLRFNPQRLDVAKRKAVVATVDRQRFVDVLLRGEAAVLNGFEADGDRLWDGIGPGNTDALKGASVDLVGVATEPMTSLLQLAMQKRARAGGGTFQLRDAEGNRVEEWLRAGSYDAAIVVDLDGPKPCWTCRWANVDPLLARAADSGDATAVTKLQARLRDDAVLLPLWRPRTVVAWRKGLNGIKANGYAPSGAWNAWEWWRNK